MKKNIASQTICAQMCSATDGSAFTSSVTCYVLGDGGTQALGSVGSGACVHEGNGVHSYVPAQAETNYDHIAFTFIGSGAIPATIQVYTTFPQTGDSFARVGAPVGASISADVAAVKAQVVTINADTDDIQSRIPAALVSGRIDASVGAMAANVLTATAINSGAITSAKFAAGAIDAAAIAADAIGASELAADAVAEIQSGLSTLTAAGVRTALGLASANLDTQLDALPTNAELATALGTADDAVLAAIAALNNLSQANIRTAVGLGSANLDTQLDALPTNAELATALGTADDAVLAQVALVKAQTDKFTNLPVLTAGGTGGQGYGAP